MECAYIINSAAWRLVAFERAGFLALQVDPRQLLAFSAGHAVVSVLAAIAFKPTLASAIREDVVLVPLRAIQRSAFAALASSIMNMVGASVVGCQGLCNLRLSRCYTQAPVCSAYTKMSAHKSWHTWSIWREHAALATQSRIIAMKW